jgi:hypothetical protein
MNQAPNSGNPKLLIAGAVALLASLYFGWQWAGQQAEAPKPVVKATPQEKPADRVKAATAPAGGPAPDGKPRTDQLMTAEEGDQYIDEVLRSNKPIPEMARELQKLVGQFNGEAQLNASRHLVNLTSDEDYGLIAGYLTNPKFNPDVLEVFFSDLMNRNRKLQMPLFMTILKDPSHPQNEQVRNVLTVLAGEDFGTDWTKWDAWAVKELANQ